MLRLRRFCYGPTGTFGRLELPSGWSCFTVERPWEANATNRSCVPEGNYALSMRYSPVVERTTDSQYREGWQLLDVPDRTYIMLHPGNTIRDTQGCICPGERLGFIDGLWAVMHSQDTFKRLMRELAVKNRWELDIRMIGRPEYP